MSEDCERTHKEWLCISSFSQNGINFMVSPFSRLTVNPSHIWPQIATIGRRVERFPIIVFWFELLLGAVPTYFKIKDSSNHIVGFLLPLLELVPLLLRTHFWTDLIVLKKPPWLDWPMTTLDWTLADPLLVCSPPSLPRNTFPWRASTKLEEETVWHNVVYFMVLHLPSWWIWSTGAWTCTVYFDTGPPPAGMLHVHAGDHRSPSFDGWQSIFQWIAGTSTGVTPRMCSCVWTKI